MIYLQIDTLLFYLQHVRNSEVTSGLLKNEIFCSPLNLGVVSWASNKPEGLKLYAKESYKSKLQIVSQHRV